jgi:hypothetical protein
VPVFAPTSPNNLEYLLALSVLASGLIATPRLSLKLISNVTPAFPYDFNKSVSVHNAAVPEISCPNFRL